MIKSPKVYFGDTGLVCHLLGLRSTAELARSPFLGPVFENHVACEIIKAQQHHGRRREIYFLRDKSGLEVDFVVPKPGGGLLFLEAKTSRTVSPRMGDPMRLFQKSGRGKTWEGWIVHPGPTLPAPASAGPGVRSVSVDDVMRVILSSANRSAD